MLDPQLALCVLLLLGTGLVTMYSAGSDFPGRFALHARNILIALAIMWTVASVPPHAMMRYAAAIYSAGVLLLLAVFMLGEVKKGSRRWLHIGFDIQPSEMMKIAMPLMLAWFFHQYSGMRRGKAFVVAGMLLLIPAALIMKQPDLGTALLVLAAGFYVIVLAGLSWKALAAFAVTAAASIPLAWPMLHEYQRQRVLTMLYPEADPLGKASRSNRPASPSAPAAWTAKAGCRARKASSASYPNAPRTSSSRCLPRSSACSASWCC